MAKLLSKAAILAAEDLPTEVVEVPEWGGSVMVRGLSGRERDAFEADVQEIRGKDVRVNRQNFRAKLLARCLVDESGKRIFGPDEVEALGGKSAVAIDRVMEAALRLSGMGATDVQEMTENFTDGQSDDSISA